MPRKNSFDMNKVMIIVNTLKDNPDGLWLRQLSRMCHMPLSTTSYYLDKVLKPIIESVRIGHEKSIIRVIKLKNGIYERLKAGESISSILKYIKIFKKIYSGE